MEEKPSYQFYFSNNQSESTDAAKVTVNDHDYGVDKINEKVQAQPLIIEHSPFRLLGSSLQECIDPISSDPSEPNDEESDWLFNCICENQDSGGQLICCDHCNAWMHIRCLQLDPNKLPDNFICPECLTSNNEKTLVSKSVDPITNENLKLNNSIPSTINIKNDSPKDTSSSKSNDISKNLVGKDSNFKTKDTEYTCECSKAIIKLIKENPSFDYTRVFKLRSNKNCHSFTLKNGQKILKSSKSVEKNGFLIEMKGSIHILENCTILNSNFNIISSTITVSIDVRASNHFSRYARRSCKPNCKIGFAIVQDSNRPIRALIYSTESIEKHQELTVPVDRTEIMLKNNNFNSSRHHWQKYDFSSAVICQCKHRKRSFDAHDYKNSSLALTECNIKKIRDTVLSIKGHLKKHATSELESSSDREEVSNHASSETDTSLPVRSVNLENSRQNMSREEKKFNYFIKLINKMEENSDEKNTKKRSRKTKSNETKSEVNSNPQSDRTDKEEPSIQSESKNNNSFPNLKNSYNNNLSGYMQQNSKNNINEVNAYPNYHNWYIPPQLSKDILAKVSSVVPEIMSKEELVNYRKHQFPIKLAIRRGLYHLAFNEQHQGLGYDSNYQNQILIQNLQNTKPSLSLAEVTTCNGNAGHAMKKSVETLSSQIGSLIEPPTKISNIERSVPFSAPSVIKSNLPPIPELRSTLASSSVKPSFPTTFKTNTSNNRDLPSK